MGAVGAGQSPQDVQNNEEEGGEEMDEDGGEEGVDQVEEGTGGEAGATTTSMEVTVVVPQKGRRGRPPKVRLASIAEGGDTSSVDQSKEAANKVGDDSKKSPTKKKKSKGHSSKRRKVRDADHASHASLNGYPTSAPEPHPQVNDVVTESPSRKRKRHAIEPVAAVAVGVVGGGVSVVGGGVGSVDIQVQHAAPPIVYGGNWEDEHDELIQSS